MQWFYKSFLKFDWKFENFEICPENWPKEYIQWILENRYDAQHFPSQFWNKNLWACIHCDLGLTLRSIQSCKNQTLCHCM